MAQTFNHATLDDWIAGEAIPFSVDSPATVNAAVDQMIAAVGDSVALLGFGEALHGGEELLLLRNRLFERLVTTHGYSAIAVESSFPKGYIVNEYIAGRVPATYAAVQDAGFSHGFGQLAANRELVEWMRQYNADPAHPVKLHFYGFDSPTEMTGTDSPHQVLHVALDYLAALDPHGTQPRRQRIDGLLGAEAAWENPAAMMDPTKSIGLSAEATALRIETEDLIMHLQIRRPELVAKSDKARYLDALQHAVVARQLLTYHAALARPADERTAELLGIRDAMMADTLAHIVVRERDHGKVLAFAHNQHLKRGQVQWQWGPNRIVWWPAGAQLAQMLGACYVVIGSAMGVSAANGIAQPEVGTLEARLSAAPGTARFIATHKGEGLPAAEIAALPTRSASTKNQTYFTLTPQSFTDFDWLAVLNTG